MTEYPAQSGVTLTFRRALIAIVHDCGKLTWVAKTSVQLLYPVLRSPTPYPAVVGSWDQKQVGVSDIALESVEGVSFVPSPSGRPL